MSRSAYIAGTAVAVLLAGCGGSSTGGSATSPTAPAGTTSSAPPPSSPAAPATPKVIWKTYTVKGTNADGVAVTATIQLEPAIHPAADVADDPDFSDALAACKADPQRDGATRAIVSLTADTGGFDASIGAGVVFGGPAHQWDWDNNTKLPGNVLLGAVYSDGSRCQNAWYGDAFVGVDAGVTGASDKSPVAWGPLNMVMILTGYYSPAHPKGNPDLRTAVSYIRSGCISSRGPSAPTGSTYVYVCPFVPVEVSGPGKTATDAPEDVRWKVR